MAGFVGSELAALQLEPLRRTQHASESRLRYCQLAPVRKAATRVSALQPGNEETTNLVAIRFLAASSAVGVSVGGAVTAFKVAIDVVHEQLWGDPLAGSLFPLLGVGVLVAVPLIGGATVSAIAATLATPADLQSGGLANLASDIAAKKPPRNPAVALKKFSASVATLSSGLSLGPEQICVEIGALIARWVGYFAVQERADAAAKQQMLLLLAAGVAAGVSAGFNAPIAGTVFAFEVFVASTPIAASTAYAPASSAAIMVSAAVSALVARAGLGDTPVFSTLALYELKRPIFELPLYLGLGGVAGLVSEAFTLMLRMSKRLFASDQLRFIVDRNLGPMMAALGCGVIALWRPEVLFFGYDMLNAILADSEVPLGVLLALLLLKPVITSLCLGAGLVGGTLAPTLFLGACLGSAFQSTVFQSTSVLIGSDGATNLIASSPAYAMVGMAACLAGVFRAPLTATILLFELTRDYRIVVPLAAASGISAWVVDLIRAAEPSQSSSNQPVQAGALQDKYSRKAKGLMGLELVDRVNASVDDDLASLTAASIMDRQPKAIDQSATPLEAAETLLVNTAANMVVIDGEGKYVGTLSASTLATAISQHHVDKIPLPPVEELLAQAAPSVSESTSMEFVSELIEESPLLGLVPVVRKGSKEVVGVIELCTELSKKAALARLQKTLELLPLKRDSS